MKSWRILLAVMLLALTTSTLGNFDADTLDKDENQVKTRSLDEDQDEDHGENHRFEGGMIDKFKNWVRNKAKKFVTKIINTKLELDGYNLSDELKEKLIEEILTAVSRSNPRCLICVYLGKDGSGSLKHHKSQRDKIVMAKRSLGCIQS